MLARVSMKRFRAVQRANSVCMDDRGDSGALILHQQLFVPKAASVALISRQASRSSIFRFMTAALTELNTQQTWHAAEPSGKAKNGFKAD